MAQTGRIIATGFLISDFTEVEVSLLTFLPSWYIHVTQWDGNFG